MRDDSKKEWVTLVNHLLENAQSEAIIVIAWKGDRHFYMNVSRNELVYKTYEDKTLKTISLEFEPIRFLYNTEEMPDSFESVVESNLGHINLAIQRGDYVIYSK